MRDIGDTYGALIVIKYAGGSSNEEISKTN
jgi:hypothetical protein